MMMSSSWQARESHRTLRILLDLQVAVETASAHRATLDARELRHFVVQVQTREQDLKFVVTLAISCSAVIKEIRRTVNTLQRLQVHAEDVHGVGSFDCREVRFVTSQMMRKATTVHFSACGVFSLDLSLICSIAQGVACYIIILVQLESSNRPT
ncbi:Protein of unknown function [Gryllus bimaculatus]|nr:Protein of unknown function [Gryllus bimaculatus]